MVPCSVAPGVLPKVLTFLTSITIIANFWVGHNAPFQHVRRFDGRLT